MRQISSQILVFLSSVFPTRVEFPSVKARKDEEARIKKEEEAKERERQKDII